MRFTLFLVVLFAFTGFAAAEPKTKQFPLNQRIVEFCKKHMGEKVGDGQCGTLAVAAIAEAGGVPWRDSPNRSGDYIWGKLLCTLAGESPAPSVAILPGDIVQMRNVVIQYPGGTATTEHHTAIVKEYSESGDLVVFEQNGPTVVVCEGSLHIPDMRSGYMRIYRPIPR